MQRKGTRKKKSRRTESERLREETLAMEMQLSKLREHIDRERKNPVKKKWRSSGDDRGTLTTYGKHYRDRRRSKRRGRDKKRESKRADISKKESRSLSPGSTLLESTENRSVSKSDDHRGARLPRTQKKAPSSAETWGLTEVCAWLTSIGLPQYKESFEKNEINGAVLLEMQAEDLDFLSIRFPAHRRMLLKGISALSSSKSDGDSAAVATETREPRSSSAKRIHWSVAAARAHEESVRSPKPTAPVSANAADDVYDEIAQRRAFQEAVMAWRKSGKSESVTSITVGAATSSSKGSKISSTNSGMWTNPFAAPGNTKAAVNDERATESEKRESLLEGEYDEIAQRRAFQAAVMEWRRGGKTAPHRDVTEVTTKSIGGAESDPAEDDFQSRESARFRDAVMQWRQGGRKSGESSEPVQKLRTAMDASHQSTMARLEQRKQIEASSSESNSAHRTAMRTLERRIHQLRVDSERNASAIPLSYNVWDVDIKF